MAGPSPEIPHEDEVLALFKRGGIRKVDRVEWLRKGYSADLKFMGFAGGEVRWLARLTPGDSLARQETQARVLREFHAAGVPCPEPLAVGRFDSRWTFLLTTFLPGTEAEEAMPTLSIANQAEIGREAGRCLAALHRRVAEESNAAWVGRRIRKYRRRVAQVEALAISFPRRSAIEAYIEDNLSLLQESPICFQHDDFHPGNLVVDRGAFGGVIDFNRCDEGDPIEDFYKVPLLTTPVSPAFARGQVEGYLAASQPARFWERYHLLLALNLHGMLAWMREVGSASEIPAWEQRVGDMILRHDWQNPDRPAWFMAQHDVAD